MQRVTRNPLHPAETPSLPEAAEPLAALQGFLQLK